MHQVDLQSFFFPIMCTILSEIHNKMLFLVFSVLIFTCFGQTLYLPPNVQFVHSDFKGVSEYSNGYKFDGISGTFEYLDSTLGGDMTSKLKLHSIYTINSFQQIDDIFIWINDGISVWNVNDTDKSCVRHSDPTGAFNCTQWHQPEPNTYFSLCHLAGTEVTQSFNITVESDGVTLTQWESTTSTPDQAETLTLTMSTFETEPPSSDFDPPANCPHFSTSKKLRNYFFLNK